VKANKPQPTDDRQGNLHDLERHANATGADLSRFRRPDRRKAVRSKGPRQEPTRGAPLRGTDPPSCPVCGRVVTDRWNIPSGRAATPGSTPFFDVTHPWRPAAGNGCGVRLGQTLRPTFGFGRAWRPRGIGSAGDRRHQRARKRSRGDQNPWKERAPSLGNGGRRYGLVGGPTP
jgi:hypothetical protein